MMNSLWIAKTGMSAQQTQMDVVSHNLSNVSTTGYKRQSAVFEDLIYQNLRQVGAQADEQNILPTGMHLGLGVRTVATTRNFTPGHAPGKRQGPGRGHQRRRFLPGANARWHHRLHP